MILLDDEFTVEECNRLRGLGWSDVDIQAYNLYLMKRRRVRKTGRSAYKDSQMNKVYAAESKFTSEYGRDRIKKFSSYAEAQKFTNKVVKSKTWSKLTTVNRDAITIVGKRNVANSRVAGLAFGSTIQLCPTYGLNVYVLLHEIAHCAGNMHHDVSFRNCLVRLVSRFISREAGDLLKSSFKELGLKMSRRTTVLSPEKWLEAKNRAVNALASRRKINE